MYSLKLLRTFYAEHLVDHRTFLTWLVHQMTSCNLAQAGFIIRLADEYLDDILSSRALTRPLVEACLAKLLEVCGTGYLPISEYDTTVRFALPALMTSSETPNYC